MSKVKSDRYSTLARVLHWTSAAVIVWATISGLYMAAFASPAVKQLISYVNISVTSLLVPVFVVRIANAILGRKPAPLEVPAVERRAARIGHGLLYAVTTLVLASGILMMEKEISVFGWLTVPQPLHDPYLTRLFATAHRATSSFLALLILGHLAAVIRHERRGRPVLKRMTWAGKRGPTASHTFVTNKSAKCHRNIKYPKALIPKLDPANCSTGELRWKP